MSHETTTIKIGGKSITIPTPLYENEEVDANTLANELIEKINREMGHIVKATRVNKPIKILKFKIFGKKKISN